MSTSPTYRCSKCESHSPRPRNLAVFIDGTSMKFGDKNTNVLKLYQRVVDSLEGPALEQRKYYLKGIGAYDAGHSSLFKSAWRTAYGWFEQGFAWNVDKNVKDAYNWLAGAYQKGDQIYLFGFSRGAYQVRALASMIHEVGLVKEREYTESAYDHYLAINPYDPETRSKAIQFKQMFCWEGVRIHFVGVWDTVSSLGLIKRDVHITESASVTNACHFRHALSLDERRVKFMPEYFLEMNAHRSVKSPRPSDADIKEVWFAGSHSDIGGAGRPGTVYDQINARYRYGDNDPGPYTVHAGNVSLLWMRQEAAVHGLVFDPQVFSWDPEDIDFGTSNSMTFWWRFLEIFPIRHQVSFSGTGKHAEWRLHLFRPRSVIPGQKIHPSILSGNVYTPRATLEDGVNVPTTRTSGKLWETESMDNGATTSLLALLLVDQQMALQYLEKVLFLLDSRLDNRQIQSIPGVQWFEGDILQQSGFDLFALTVIYHVTSNFSASEELVNSAIASLSMILRFADDPAFYKTLCVLQFLAKNQELRRRFIGHDNVIEALVLALKGTANSSNECLFLLVVGGLCSLIGDDDLRGRVVRQLSLTSNETKTIQSRLSVSLKVKSPNQLAASLQMIASLAQFERDLCKPLEPNICRLAKKGKYPVCSAAVKALVALGAPQISRDIHISSILGYLGDILPRLDVEVGPDPSDHDVEVGRTPSQANNDDLPTVLLANGHEETDDGVMRKLVSTIGSHSIRERTVATLTLLKLYRYPIVQEFCSRNKVLDIFMRQLKRQKTCLLAAYALETCLECKIWTPDNYDRAAPLIVNMLKRGWFDDAVGLVEGRDIFGRLVQSADLRQGIINRKAVDILVNQLETGNRHEVRMSLSYLDILGTHNSLELGPIVADYVTHLKDENEQVHRKSVKVLAALAQAAAGEQAIMPHVMEIVRMLPTLDRPSELDSMPPGPVYAVYDLCNNDNLREQIQNTPEFRAFKNRHRTLQSEMARAT